LIREISDQSSRSFSVPNSQSLPACRELLLPLRVLWRDERAKEAGDASNTSEKVSTNGGGCSRATINLAISAQRMKFLLKNFCSGDKVLALLVLVPDSLKSKPSETISSRREERETHNENCVWLPVAGGGERERGREVT
jgi:hypothetical protein